VALFALREVARCGVFFSRQGHHSGTRKDRPQISPRAVSLMNTPLPDPAGAAGEVTPAQAAVIL
jgi:hypothetical protein